MTTETNAPPEPIDPQPEPELSAERPPYAPSTGLRAFTGLRAPAPEDDQAAGK